jgi:hypothetical protein
LNAIFLIGFPVVKRFSVITFHKLTYFQTLNLFFLALRPSKRTAGRAFFEESELTAARNLTNSSQCF